MKYRSFVILLLFLTAILSIGAISAAEISSDIAADASSDASADLVADTSVDVSTDASNDNSNAVDDGKNIESADSAAVSTADQSSAVNATKQSNSTKSVKKIATKVSADQVAFEYKKSKYFKVKVKDKKGHKLKNIKIKLKIYTGSKSKTYTVKTNSDGVAKFNTKSLKIGSHKVAISSANDKYKISKSSKIFIGKKQSVTLKLNSKKTLKNKDVLTLKLKKESDGDKEVKVAFKKTPKYTKVVKAVFYLKNLKTGKIIKKTDDGEFDDGRWEMPDEDFSKKYSLVKVKVTYLNYK